MRLSLNWAGNDCSEPVVWQEHESHFWWQGRRDPVPSSPPHYQNWPLPPFYLHITRSSLASHGVLMATHTHPCSRLHLTDGLELTKSCSPTLPGELFTPPTPRSTLSSRAATSKLSVPAAHLSFKENLGIKAAVSQEDSQVCLPLKGGGHTQKDKMSRELLRKYIHLSISSRH